MFYIDFEGHTTDPVVTEVLEALKENCLYIKNLGHTHRRRIRRRSGYDF